MDLSVAQFCQRAQELMNSDDAAFVRYVLNGVDEGEEIRLNPLLDALQDEEEVEARRDYDSLLGIADDILVKTELSVFPVPKLTDTLTTDIHITHPFQIGDANLGDPRHPQGPKYFPQLTQDEMKSFYNQGLRPAIVELTPAQSAEWPSTYEGEMWRARGRTGQLALSSKVVDAWYVSMIGQRIRSSLEENGVAWGRGLVFLHEIRGVKHGSGHSVGADAADRTLGDWLADHDLSREEMGESGTWYIDVGVEFVSLEERCLAWRTDSHRHIVEAVISIPENRAASISRPGSSKYTRDMVSHMPSISGCRISPGLHTRGPYDVRYFQLYTTDKALTYRPEGYHRGKFITPSDILKGKVDTFIEGLYDTYSNAASRNWSLARMEVRVPLEHAEEVLLLQHLSAARTWLISFHKKVFWSLRAYRAAALKFVLQWQADYDGSLRVKMPALLLTAAASWLINSLHSSPDKGASCKQLMKAVLPLEDRSEVHLDVMAFGTPTDDNDVGSDGESDNEESGLVPTWSRGLVFLNAIRLGEGIPVPRFRDNTGRLTENAFTFFFGTNLKGIQHFDFGTTIRRPPNPDRIRNKVTKTPKLWPEAENRELDHPFTIPDDAIHRIQPMDQDEGSDLGDDDTVDDGLPGNVNDALELIWKEFLVDLAEKSPNRSSRQDPSYCRLDANQRKRIRESAYIGDPTEFFDDFQWKYASVEEWRRVFSRLFPDKTQDVSGRVQGYHTTRWFQDWIKLRARVDSVGLEDMRKQLKRRVNRFCWLPFAQTDKLWTTKAQTGKGWAYMEEWMNSDSPSTAKRPCPAIYINPNRRR
ncbi:hypothetical protein PLEOSDRAFT_1108039 [Pleurotus ostreatus PC15]|uniref:Uncharacterized protein n=1 Tax=Pleurotus ostreatus (strain PC15) TaxID=1137138 RepID=A0A067NNE5_PLEO1|nr:hypothetical protein PLEOSDRAFT_1109181 [Pleurotus ostreatus PC15]KDQ22067.1 hypothetical protein PLEOSDRAFT_1109187 [Pleurotus ostreatus PC15]KDQ25136.1 hypothetical protein PLEOSDRAFT_1108039 [Pleurotus ostreatus PC15]